MTSLTERFSTSFGLARSLVVYYGQPWRRSALRQFYASIVKPGDLVFDIGAHVGSRSSTLLKLGAKVVAVEPQPAFADFIESRFAGSLAGFERVAVGRSAGQIDLLISSRHPTVTSISSRFVETVKQSKAFSQVVWDRKVTVPMVTLDHLVAKYGMPSFCKIDVEGAEAEILYGLSKPIPLIAFEYIPAMPSVASNAIDRLMGIGSYRFNRVVGEQHRFVSDRWKSADELLVELSQMPPEAQSGDVYARIESR
ncbi:MAG: FkbM family methyltransferase [Alphaproteobacteria bacterium]|nr:FkbM family methyltransferase [Alphaproteobacteria bacterium]MBU0834518.1 FkbM family methyltransferase [Alphaproteobacteria bacterium]MBU1763211.1 FkbM family methyltransferase [Alphaproteobacteria bacterium]MDM7979288.1 FkbM family methyltransferase [Rhizobium sp.]MDM8015926.1 FkbM family methyltransferase [Rhizobium sp.]